MWKGGKNNGEEDGSLNLNNYNDFYNHPLKTMKLLWFHCDYTMWMKLTTWMPSYHSKDEYGWILIAKVGIHKKM
jgi:hypothetical protein